MDFKNFVGIDVSKNTLDITFVVDAKIKLHQQIKNTNKEIKTVLPKLLKQLDATHDNTLFCMEFTGIYNNLLVAWLNEKEYKVWLESAVQISKCMGVTRGKNDKVDSARIAMYAFTNRHLVRLWRAPKPIITKIAALLSQRTRLIKARKLLVMGTVDQALFMDKDICKALKSFIQKPIISLDNQIKEIEAAILELIKSNDRLCRLYKIMLSINGLGFVTASYILVTTNEFISISEAKKYACYAGVVPFEHSSGSSVRGRTRVSHRANKTVKTLLHMSALAAIRTEGDLKNYYLRKVQEGKNKMSVLNAVRNKLVLRIFSCVENDRMYEKNYCQTLV